MGLALQETQLADLLRLVADIKIVKFHYVGWNECIGSFMSTMGPESFFKILPMRLCDHDFNSLQYAQESKSYLLPVIQKYLKRGDLAFFVQYFMPQINQLDEVRKQCLNQRNPNYSLVKAKKYETLIVQIWETAHIFCRFNSARLLESFSSMLPYLEAMGNKNVLGLNAVALRIFSEMISHCRNTPVVTDQIKKTRTGLQRIAPDYIKGLS
jgi:hypothetical protein